MSTPSPPGHNLGCFFSHRLRKMQICLKHFPHGKKTQNGGCYTKTDIWCKIVSAISYLISMRPTVLNANVHIINICHRKKTYAKFKIPACISFVIYSYLQGQNIWTGSNLWSQSTICINNIAEVCEVISNTITIHKTWISKLLV